MNARFACCDRVRARRDWASVLIRFTGASALKKAVLAEGSKEMNIWARREHDDRDDVPDEFGDGFLEEAGLLRLGSNMSTTPSLCRWILDEDVAMMNVDLDLYVCVCVCVVPQVVNRLATEEAKEVKSSSSQLGSWKDESEYISNR